MLDNFLNDTSGLIWLGVVGLFFLILYLIKRLKKSKK